MKFKLLIALIGVIIISIPLGYTYGTKEQVNFIVKDKERVVQNESSKYLIYTEDEVFENTDSIMYWKFGSSDIYSNLEVGTNYSATVYGWRIRFLSSYRNIVSVEEI